MILSLIYNVLIVIVITIKNKDILKVVLKHKAIKSYAFASIFKTLQNSILRRLKTK